MTGELKLTLASLGAVREVGVDTPDTESWDLFLADLLKSQDDYAASAPSIEAARPVADEEIRQMQSMCEDHDPNTMIVIERIIEDIGIRERFRLIPPQSASLAAFAVHGDVN